MKAVPMIGIIWSIALLVFSQIPAPESAVDNLMLQQSPMGEPTYPVLWDGRTYPNMSAGSITKSDSRWLIQQWQQYKAECYADSTESVYGKFTWLYNNPADSNALYGKTMYEYWDGNNWIMQEKPIKYIHKQPTADGFLDWLMERGKR